MKHQAICALLLAAAVWAQELPVVLRVEVENFVRYGGNVDPSRVATSPVPQPPSPNPQLNFTRTVLFADVIAVNGSPAKGILVQLDNGIRVTTTPLVPLPGGAIGDLMRPTFGLLSFELLKPDGGQIGSILATGTSGPVPAPGSPPSVLAGTWAIVGGSGPFVGAKGTLNALQCASCRPIRTTTQEEDPSMRRINGGGQGVMLFQLFPMFRPEVLIGPNGPVAFHNDDYRPVTADRPARPGESLILYAKGLGPTNPSVNPGDPFPNEPFAQVTSPVEVLVNGRSAPATNQLGVPGTTDTYRVDFRVPDGTAAGTANVQISAAWVKGTAVSIPVR